MDATNTATATPPALAGPGPAGDPAAAPGADPRRPTRPGAAAARRRRGITSRRGWGEAAYALVDLAPAVFLFSAIVTLLAAGAGLAVVYVGVPVLMVALVLARLGAAVQIGLARSLLGMPIALPGPPRRARPGLGGVVRAVLTDAVAWRAVGYFLVKIALAPAAFAVASTLYCFGLGAVTYPAWRAFLPGQAGADGAWHHGTALWNGHIIDTWPDMALLGAAGLVVLLAAPHVLRWVVAVDRMLITSLLAPR